MSLTVSKQKQIVGLTVPLTLNCRIFTDSNMDGSISSNEAVFEDGRPKTFTAPPVPAKPESVTSYYPLGNKFEIESQPPVFTTNAQPPLGSYAEAYTIKAEFMPGSYGRAGHPLPRKAAVIHGEVIFRTKSGPPFQYGGRWVTRTDHRRVQGRPAGPGMHARGPF